MSDTTTLTPSSPTATNSHTSRFIGAEIFSINFIRREMVPLRIRRVVVTLAVGYLAVHLLVAVLLICSAIVSHMQVQQLRASLQEQRPSATALTVRQQDMRDLREQVTHTLTMLNTMLALQKSRVPVGGKLAGLTRTLPPRTWITSLAGDRADRTLKIQAAYLIDPEHPDALPMKGWLEALKADAAFGHGLQRLDLGSSSRQAHGKAKLVTFELVAEWQPFLGR